MAPYTRYSLDPDGGYTFFDDAGGSMRAAGPSAEAYARDLDAASLYATPAMPAPPPAPEPYLYAGPGAGAAAQATEQTTQAGQAAADAERQARRDKAALEAAARRPPPKPAAPAGEVLDADSPDFLQATPVRPAEAATPAPPPRREPLPGERPAPPPREQSFAATSPPPAAAPEPSVSERTSDSTTVQSGTSRTSQSGFSRSLGPDPRETAGYLAADEDAARYGARIVQQQAEASRDIAAAQAEMAYERDLQAMHLASIEAETQARLAPINQQMERALEEVRSAKVDPGRIWKERGTEGQIGAAIAMAFGAIGQGMAGGENEAFRVIQGAIDRDVQLQLADIDKKRGDVTMLAQIGREVIAQGGDRKTAEVAMRAAAMGAVEAKIQGIAAKADAAMGDDGVSFKAQQFESLARKARRGDMMAVSERMRGTVQGQSSTTSQTQVSKTKTTETAPTGTGEDGTPLRTIVLDDGSGKPQRFAVNDQLRDEDYSKMVANAELLKQMNASLAEMEKSKKEEPGLRGEAKRRAGEKFKWHSTQVGRIISTLVKQGVLQAQEQKQVAIENGNIVDGDEVIASAREFGNRARGFMIDQGNATQVPMDYGKANPFGRRPMKKGKK